MAIITLLPVSVVRAESPSTINPRDLFEEPVPLTNGKGEVLVTGRGQGCPYVVDYNGDGLLDIVLGGKFKAYSGPGAIWLFPNTGSQKKPAFNKSDAYQVPIPGMPEIGCG